MNEPRIDTASRHIPAPPGALYRAFIDPAALVRWLPPAGMTGRVDAFEPRPGGRFEVVLAYDRAADRGEGKSSADADVVRGRFVELVPDRLIVQVVAFESPDPAFAGEMRMTWRFDAEPGGTRVTIRAENVPSGIRPQDHQAGMESTLANLAAFVQGGG
jgi:uncharacterized protein YndB with AHSA1/START domain